MSAVYELQESRGISTSGGRGLGNRSFICEGYASASDVINIIGTTVGGVAIPDKGDVHPEFPGLIATDLSLSPIADSRSGASALSWQLTFQYEVVSIGFGDTVPTVIETLPNEVGYVEITSNIRAEFVSAWRTGNVDYPTDGDPSGDEDEVGGTAIDRRGNPVSVQRNIQELTITETVNSPAWSNYRDYRFLRNSTVFQGAPVGKVLYKGASVTRTGVDVYKVSHQFVEDSDFHLQQYPAIDQEGEAIDQDANGHADLVYWIQPFPNKGNFNLISGNF